MNLHINDRKLFPKKSNPQFTNKKLPQPHPLLSSVIPFLHSETKISFIYDS